MSQEPRDFPAIATPGTGKITFALRITSELMGAGIVDKFTVACPIEHLRGQQVDAAARVGIRINPAFTNSQDRVGSHYDGAAATYARAAVNPPMHATRTHAYPTFIILNEIHHAGDTLS